MYIPGTLQALMHIFRFMHLRYFDAYAFHNFPSGQFVFDLRYLLNVAAQSAAISYWFRHGCWERVAGVISVRSLRALKEHVPLFNDTLSHLILRTIWAQIFMTECLLLLFIDCATHSCELCCQHCMSWEANFLIDGQTVLQYSLQTCRL